MSFIDRPPRLRAPALSAAALIHAGLFALITQFASVVEQPARLESPALVTFPTTHSAPASPRQEEQREKPKQRSARKPPAAPSADPIQHPAADSIPRPLEQASARADLPGIALQQTSMREVPRPVPVPPADIPDARDLLAAYSARLRALILARQPTPSTGSGQVTVGFEVAPTGGVVNSAVVASSGNVRLDRAALNMVRRAAPFPRPDQAIPADKLHFRIEVRFH